jgi:hypothetical protein
VLVAQPATDGASWLWTIAPRATSIAQLLASRDRTERAELLASYGAAVADALKVQASHPVRLDLGPRSFGVRHGVVRYLGEILPGDAAGVDAGRALDEALASLVAASDDVEPAVAALESALASRLSKDERAKLARAATWEDPASLPPHLLEAQRRIADALERGRKAA